MRRLRLVTWNCRSGSAATRLAELAEYDPNLVFLQECWPVEDPATPHVLCRRTINAHKGIAWLSASPSRRLVTRSEPTPFRRATLALEILEPVRFMVIGVWARGPDYEKDLLATVRAHAHLVCPGPGVIIGDLNSGSRLGPSASLTTHHRRVLAMFGEFGLVSAYHAFHHVEPGNEADATYYHQCKRSKRWHIDFCFVPRAWTSRIMNVAVIDGRRWARRSDHRPLLVDIAL